MAASDGRPVPRKNVAFRLQLAVRKNDGTLITTWAGMDSNVSLDNVGFVACTNEAVETETSGCGYLDLTAGEMNADCVTVKITVTNTGAIPIVVVIYPEEAGDMRAAPAGNALTDTVWTDAKAGYLVGQVATQADVAAITQAQRVRLALPAMLERPDSSSVAYRVWIYVYDEQHKAEDLDSIPTVTVENNTGVDRSANLGTVTKPGATTGQYYVDYTVASGHAIEGLLFKVNAVEGGVTTQYAGPSIVVDTTAVDFTSADRVKLDTLHDTRLTANRALALDNLDVATSSLATVVGLAAAKTILDKFDTMVALDGAVYRFTANALELAPAGGVGGDGVWTVGEKDGVVAESAAIWAKVNGWVAPLVVYNGGVAADGSILYLRQGDAYKAALGNALAWSSTTWLDLTGATAKLVIVDQLSGTTLINQDASITLGATQIVTAELTSTQSRTLPVGKGTARFAIVITKGGETLGIVVGVVHTTKE